MMVEITEHLLKWSEKICSRAAKNRHSIGKNNLAHVEAGFAGDSSQEVLLIQVEWNMLLQPQSILTWINLKTWLEN